MDVDHRDRQLVEKVAGQDLHVPREHDEVAVAAQQLEQLVLRLRLVVALHGNVVVRDAIRLHVLPEIGVV